MLRHECDLHDVTSFPEPPGCSPRAPVPGRTVVNPAAARGFTMKERGSSASRADTDVGRARGLHRSLTEDRTTYVVPAETARPTPTASPTRARRARRQRRANVSEVSLEELRDSRRTSSSPNGPKKSPAAPRLLGGHRERGWGAAPRNTTPRTASPASRHPLVDQQRLDDCARHPHFNRLFWDCGTAPTTVIEHGPPDPGSRYRGERSTVGIRDQRAGPAVADYRNPTSSSTSRASRSTPSASTEIAARSTPGQEVDTVKFAGQPRPCSSSTRR